MELGNPDNERNPYEAEWYWKIHWERDEGKKGGPTNQKTNHNTAHQSSM